MHAWHWHLAHHYNYSFFLDTKIGRPNLHLSQQQQDWGEFSWRIWERPRPNTPKANKEPVVVFDMDAGLAGSTRRACVHRNKSVYERSKRRAALVRVSEWVCGWMSDLMILEGQYFF